MVSFRYLATDLVMVAACVGAAAAQEPRSRSEALTKRSIQREAEIGG